MSKVIGPLLSFRAQKSIAKTLTFQSNKGIDIVRKIPYMKKSRSYCQNNRRIVYKNACNLWRNRPDIINQDQKDCWNALAFGKKLTGLNLFFSEYLTINLNGCEIIAPEQIPQCSLEPSRYFLLTEEGWDLLLENYGQIELE